LHENTYSAPLTYLSAQFNPNPDPSSPPLSTLLPGPTPKVHLEAEGVAMGRRFNRLEELVVVEADSTACVSQAG